MFDKKRTLICSILLYAVGTVTALLTVYFHYKGDTSSKIGFLIFCIMAYAVALVMTFIYFILKKREQTVTTHYEKPDMDEQEFNDWLNNFEPYVKTAKKLLQTSSKTFSKFGGMPDVPSDFKWAMRGNVPLPFLLQVDFAEINADGALIDFPQSGIMYVFVDSNDVNSPDFSDGEDFYSEGKTFKIIFYDESYNLSPAKKPDNLQTVYREFNVSAESIKTYPDTEDCEDAFNIYCNRPEGGMDDGYDDLQGENIQSTLIGGWATYIQGSDILPNCKDDEWVLLMQIASYEDESGDNGMLWGDDGNIYMFIRKSDLKARKFNNVKFDMQCY